MGDGGGVTLSLFISYARNTIVETKSTGVSDAKLESIQLERTKDLTSYETAARQKFPRRSHFHRSPLKYH